MTRIWNSDLIKEPKQFHNNNVDQYKENIKNKDIDDKSTNNEEY